MTKSKFFQSSEPQISESQWKIKRATQAVFQKSGKSANIICAEIADQYGITLRPSDIYNYTGSHPHVIPAHLIGPFSKICGHTDIIDAIRSDFGGIHFIDEESKKLLELFNLKKKEMHILTEEEKIWNEIKKRYLKEIGGENGK